MKVTTIQKASDLKMMQVNDFTGCSVTSLKTTEDRVYAYKNAEMIIDSFIERERNGAVSKLRAEALREEKKAIFGVDLWREPLNRVPQDLVDKWYDFLGKIDELDKNGKQSRRVADLLRFANYGETSKLKGVSVVAPNENQLAKLSSLSNSGHKKANLVTISKMYEVLAKEYNDGQPFKSATDVEKAYIAYHESPPKKKKDKKKKKKESSKKEKEVETVYVREIFSEEFGECPPRGLNSMAMGSEVLKYVPSITEEQWKTWMRKVAKCVHPDHGGSEIDTMILNKFRGMMDLLFKNQKMDELNAQWEADYKMWKQDHGYESDFVEREVN